MFCVKVKEGETGFSNADELGSVVTHRGLCVCLSKNAGWPTLRDGTTKEDALEWRSIFLFLS